MSLQVFEASGRHGHAAAKAQRLRGGVGEEEEGSRGGRGGEAEREAARVAAGMAEGARRRGECGSGAAETN